MTYIAYGKQVLRDGLHFADGCDVSAAVTIAAALNAYDLIVEIPCDICKMTGDHVPTCENGKGET